MPGYAMDPAGNEKGSRPMVALIVVAVVVAVRRCSSAARTIRVIPQARAGVVERLGRYSRTLEPGLTIVTPFIDRVRPLVDLREQVVNFSPQPVITEDNVVVGDRDGPVLHDHRPPLGHLRNRQSTAGDRAADRHDAAQRDRRADAGGDADLARERQHRAAHRPGRGDRQVGDPDQPRRDQVGRSAAGHQTAMEKQMRAERDRRAAILTAEGEKQSQILTAEGAKQAAVLTAEGAKQARFSTPRASARRRSCAPRAKPRRSTPSSKRSTRANRTASC